MALRRFVYLVSKSPFKLREFTREFDKYGITVVQVSPEALGLDDAGSAELDSTKVERLLSGAEIDADRAAHKCGPSDRVRVVAALREQTRLYKHGSAELCDMLQAHHLRRVTHVSWTRSGLTAPNQPRTSMPAV